LIFCYLINRWKKQSTVAKYSYHERLLGVARLLAEVHTDIALILKHYFVQFLE
jgi:hypothetical protein